ncbi:hypothetical protein Gorai_019954, partial [Gossypium raimondii]|nr:hypothetical protein [Gossypium raimondii]
PTFKRIIRNQSIENFSGLPYIYALLNCLICTWYGTPLVSHDNVLVMTVNSIGAVFQITYIVTFIVYADKEKKMRMLGMLLGVFGLLAIIVAGSLQIADRATRWIFVGFLSCASLISMFASPLFIIVPNGIGTILGILQLALYFRYKAKSMEESNEPLMVSQA